MEPRPPRQFALFCINKPPPRQFLFFFDGHTDYPYFTQLSILMPQRQEPFHAPPILRFGLASEELVPRPFIDGSIHLRAKSIDLLLRQLRSAWGNTEHYGVCCLGVHVSTSPGQRVRSEE